MLLASFSNICKKSLIFLMGRSDTDESIITRVLILVVMAILMNLLVEYLFLYRKSHLLLIVSYQFKTTRIFLEYIRQHNSLGANRQMCVF